MDRPLLSAVYGLLAQVVVVIAVAYAYSLVAGGRPAVVAIGLTVVAVAWVVAASFGFVVVSLGIGGRTRQWVHASQSVDRNTESSR